MKRDTIYNLVDISVWITVKDAIENITEDAIEDFVHYSIRDFIEEIIEDSKLSDLTEPFYVGIARGLKIL